MKDFERGLTAERLRTLLHYCPETGAFRWLVSNSARRPAGSAAGELKPSGYILIGINGWRYRAHRLAWLYVTGEWPQVQIDHRDNDRSNNKWLNLRPADNAQNQANAKRPKNNTSGFKGVFWNKQRQKWAAKINPDRRQVHLGFFADPKEAHAAYCRGAEKFFGEFARAA